jgi:uncharacterized phage protein (TIGR02218 family)
MKTLGDIQTNLNSEVQTLARFWKITRQDNVSLGFTNYSQNLTIDGLIYKAATGFTATAIQADVDVNPINMELSSILNENGIKADDMKRGIYDYARVKVFMANYLSLPSSLTESPPNYLPLVTGIIGKVSYSEDSFKAEVLSLATLLGGKISNVISPTCRYKFGDGKCTVNLASFTKSLSVTYVDENNWFNINTVFPDDYFTGSKLTWTSGDNDGLEQLVIRSEANRIYPQTYLTVTIGDDCDVIASCNKTEADCSKFNNRINFGGEPKIPGLDSYYSGEA